VSAVQQQATIKAHFSKAGRFLSEIREADGVEIFSLVDNSVDFLSSIHRKEVNSFRQWTKKRNGQEWVNAHSQLPFAEHGFSMLVRVLAEGKFHSILFDTGSSPDSVVDNAARMGLDLSEVGGIVLSHGHYDHSGGLLSVLKAINKVDLPIIVHDDMFKKRGIASQDGSIRTYPEFPTKEQMGSTQLTSTRQPSLFANGLVLVTGEIPREKSFEKGYAQHRAFINGSWQPDPWIWDDRAIVINIEGKGLVILSGCAHAGIVNTIRYAQQITGLSKIYAVIGGFHLAGKEGESRIEQSVEELRKINPNLIVPSHCTGWRAKCTIAKTMPNAFVWNSVGNLYQL
jgi:7,8-dihydropterin-6-yl-methyl-4-(beta-D-ribofuranosyl)aminobenzene 5'-phosphate synthase